MSAVQPYLPELLRHSAWCVVRDGNPSAMAIFQRHYTYKQSRLLYQFVGPGEKHVLLTPNCDALFVWRKFINDAGEDGVNCAVFRNESRILSSSLINEAEALAWERWPGQRLYTYVNPTKIRSTNPGFCFLMAGWRKCGTTPKGLIVLEKLPSKEIE